MESTNPRLNIDGAALAKLNAGHYRKEAKRVRDRAIKSRKVQSANADEARAIFDAVRWTEIRRAQLDGIIEYLRHQRPGVRKVLSQLLTDRYERAGSYERDVITIPLEALREGAGGSDPRTWGAA